jgi:hypothetical protein
MRLSLIVFLLLLLPGIVAAEKISADAWQVGTLTDSSESWHSRSAGYINGGQGYGVHGGMVSREYPIVRYIIDNNTYRYEAELALRHKRDKHPSVTVNGKIKFAIVNSDLYVHDEQDKEFKLTLVKKALKTQPPVEQK